MTAAHQHGWRGPHVVWRARRALVASDRNLVIARWDGTPTGAQLRALETHAAEIARAYPRGVALMNVVVGAARSRFDEEARAETARIVKAERESSLGVANVVLLDGFAGVAARAFLSTVTAVARPRSPMQTFAAIDRAAVWLAERLSSVEPWSPEDIAMAWQALPR